MKSMMLITSTWKDGKTFRLIPVEATCPYNECIYDPDGKVLAVISKDRKTSLHMVPKINDLGDVEYLKVGKRDNGKQYKEERKSLDTFYEYYIETEQDIMDFVNMFAVNNHTFDYAQYFKQQSTLIAPSSL